MEKKTLALCGASLSLLLLATGCAAPEAPAETSSAAESPAPETSSAASTEPSAEPSEAETSTPPAEDIVPGYGYGEAPAVPLFEIPDLSLIEQSLDKANAGLSKELASYPGLKTSPVRCDEAGVVQSGAGFASLYGDGAGVIADGQRSITTDGQGSGTFQVGDDTVTLGGDGSGTFTNGTIAVTSSADGSGTYTDEQIAVTLNGKGSGTYTSGDEAITNNGDGSGTYTNDEMEIVNNGDGTGMYSDDLVTIINHGNGTGLVNGTRAELEPLDPVPALGKFPPMGQLKPIKSCGTLITMESAVLFDIDKYEIRPEAGEALEAVASALDEVEAGTVKVQGHTDSVRDEAWNQQLSEDRAQAVVDQLEQLGSSADFEAEGFGESRPVASNDTDAGRQRNRRVEIFISAS